MFRLDRKVAIVTGAAHGIGRAIAEKLAEAGASVLLVDIDAEVGTEVVSGIREKGGNSVFLHADVTSSEDARKAVDLALESFGGKIHVLCNNAAFIGPFHAGLESTQEEWDQCFQVTLMGTYYYTREVLPTMIKQKDGVILMTGSNCGVVACPEMLSYSTVKAGLSGFTRSIALDYVEQPVPAWDIKGMKEVAQAVDVPLCADESCQSPEDALRLADEGACEVFCLYLSESGGMTRAEQILAIADAAGIDCVLGTWGESGVGFAAGLHLAASSRNFSLASDQGYYLLKEDYVDQPFSWEEGRVPVPGRPGLGVVPDQVKMEGLKRYVGLDRVFDDKTGLGRFIPVERKLQV